MEKSSGKRANKAQVQVDAKGLQKAELALKFSSSKRVWL
jgi:hypothetical protein